MIRYLQHMGLALLASLLGWASQSLTLYGFAAVFYAVGAGQYIMALIALRRIRRDRRERPERRSHPTGDQGEHRRAGAASTADHAARRAHDNVRVDGREHCGSNGGAVVRGSPGDVFGTGGGEGTKEPRLGTCPCNGCGNRHGPWHEKSCAAYRASCDPYCRYPLCPCAANARRSGGERG